MRLTPTRALVLAAAAVAALACSDTGTSTSPSLGRTNATGQAGGKDTSVTGGTGGTGGDSSTTGGTGGDSSTTGGTGGDSSSTGGTGGGDTTVVVDTVVGSLTPGIHGSVWGAKLVAGSDTAIYVLVPGIAVTIETQPGPGAAPALVATLTSDAGGKFSVGSVADGIYQAHAVPPAGSGYRQADAVNITVAGGRMTTYREVNLVMGIAP